jgi:hypothetical protein
MAEKPYFPITINLWINLCITFNHLIVYMHKHNSLGLVKLLVTYN